MLESLIRRQLHELYNRTVSYLLYLKFLHVFGALCYPTNDSENLRKLKPKADIGLIPKSVHSTSRNPPSKKDLDILFQPMFDEYFKPSPSVVSLTISAVTLPQDTAGATSSISIDQDAPSPKFDSDTFINPFAPLVTNSNESSSSRIVDTSNMHTFNQPLSHTRKWNKDHPLKTINGNLSKPVSTRSELSTNAMWCYFHAFLTKVEPKNYQEAMKESSWIKAMQEEIHEFDRLKVWELVPISSNTMLIALKWIFKVKLDEYGDVLN
ncbi:retrovirus-related pol polyprotein from transposon TNT 1-94 [Tanacetum coccineum]